MLIISVSQDAKKTPKENTDDSYGILLSDPKQQNHKTIIQEVYQNVCSLFSDKANLNGFKIDLSSELVTLISRK